MLSQAVLCDFITEGHFARPVRRTREVYAERLATLIECANTELAGALTITGVEAGLQTAAWLSDGHVATQVADHAARRQVDVAPLSRYTRGAAAREGLQLGFAAVDVAEIRRGVRQLATVLDHDRRRRHRR